MSTVKEQIAQLTPDKRALLLKKLRAQNQTDETNRDSATGTQRLPLRPVERAQPLPLSFAQERLWILQELQGPSITYNAPVAWRIVGGLDKVAFAQALQALLQRHESLRTTIGLVDKQPVQIIRECEAVALTAVDLQPALQALSAPEQATQVQAFLQQVAARPFDLQRECPIRLTLVTLGPEEHLFVVNLHHIVIDGWSLQRFVQELSALYAAFLHQESAPLPPLPIQYADFAAWQRTWLQGDVLAEKLAYWQTHLTAANGAPPPPLQLPTDFPRPAVQTFAGAIYRFDWPPTLQAQLQQLSQTHGATLFMTLYAAFSVLMARYSGQRELIVGTTVANRTQQESVPLIGFLTNMLALRTDVAANPTFAAMLAQVRQTMTAAYQHQDLPFEKVVEAVRPERSLSHEPLVQVVFDLQSAPPRPLTLPGLTVTPLPLDLPVAKYDLGVSLVQTPEGLHGEVEYSTALFTAATIERMMGHFRVLLSAVCANPNQPVWQLPLLTPAEEEQLLVEWNATAVAWPSTQCVPELVAAQAAARPAATALLFGDQRMSYGELNARANQLAHHLQTLGVGAETMVGVCLERSLDLVVSILAVLKAGGAYLPLDPSYPPERLRFMLADAGVTVLLTQAALVERLAVAEPAADAPRHCFCVDRQWATIAPLPTTNPAPTATLDSLAYTIYTSGSTGQPKGVLIPHRGLCNLVAWHQRAFAITAADHATVLAGLGFDAAVWEMWPYLTAGATLHLIDPTTLGSAEHLRDWLVAQAITVTFLPTPLAEQVLPLPWPATTALRFMLTGGDRLRSYPAPDLPFALVNNYGPTENSVVTTAGLVVNHGRPTPAIGRPIDNVQLYVLDPYLQPTPIGVPGELHIGGSSLARGYLRRPALTAEKFIDNPFPAPTGRGYLYKTGDLVRYLPTGELEFLGRTDSQVKIRGFRIELGEIESRLRQHPAVREAVVLVTAEAGEPRLLAYVVPHTEKPAVEELRHHLTTALPEYMIPAQFVLLAALPLTPNGKIDHVALQNYRDEVDAPEPAFVPPRTPTEHELEGIWTELMKLEQISVHTNFFEIGGHSLLAMQTVSLIYAVFGVELTQYALFEKPTIAELAEYIDSLKMAQALHADPDQLDSAHQIVEW
jgi:amino acid adenylation domain-containing protein